MDSYQAWRDAIETGPSARSWRSLTTTTFDGLHVEPLPAPAPARPPLPARASAVLTGSVLGTGEAVDLGPQLAWWMGTPGPISASLKLAILESDAPPGVGLGAVERLVIGVRASEGARLASNAPLLAAEAGAGSVAELASALVALANALDQQVPPEGLALALSVGTDFFLEVAKLRAARRAVAGMLAAAGHQARALPIAVRQTFRSLAASDVETNALRSALAGAAGLIGGASYVALRPHDGALLHRGALAARLAWTQGEILERESGLHDMDDASEGAPFIEALTDQVGEASWSLARTVLGGDTQALPSRIARDAEARHQAVSTRRLPLVGVSRFVGHSEESVGGARDAQPFEALHRAGRGKQGVVIAVGDRKLEPRVAFAREALELAGLEVISLPRAADVAAAVQAFEALAPKPAYAIIAVPDAAFEGDALALTKVLAGSCTLLVAGKPGAQEAALRAAGVRAFVYQGTDLPQVLLSMLEAGAA